MHFLLKIIHYNKIFTTCQSIWGSGQGFMHDQVSVIIDKRGSFVHFDAI